MDMRKLRIRLGLPNKLSEQSMTYLEGAQVHLEDMYADHIKWRQEHLERIKYHRKKAQEEVDMIAALKVLLNEVNDAIASQAPGTDADTFAWLESIRRK